MVSNLEKMTISSVIETCKPLILLGLQKNSKNISTQHLTVLTTGVILRLEQRVNTVFRKEEQYEYQ